MFFSNQKTAYEVRISCWTSDVCSSDLLSDIAEVGDGQSEIRGFARLNGRPITAVQISKTNDESDVTVETRVLATIAELQQENHAVRFTKVIYPVDTHRRSITSTHPVLINTIFLEIF